VRGQQDGGIEVDNHAAERSLRGVALGRKNCLFAGSDAGGERAEAMYSLSGSAKLNGLDPLSATSAGPHSRTIPLTALRSRCPGA
jgi:transposase